MKYNSNKDNVLNEIYNFLIKNYDKPNDISYTKDSFDKSLVLRYNMYNNTLILTYIVNSSNELLTIKIDIGYNEITRYIVGENFLNKKYKFIKSLYKYFKSKEEDKIYTDIYNNIKTNKPVKVERSDKLKNILN